MRGPGDTEPTIPDEPDLPVPNDPGDPEPCIRFKDPGKSGVVVPD